MRAESNGIAGYSGNPTRNGGANCGDCHYDGTFSITATINGPTTVAPGTNNVSYSISKSGSASSRIGFNLSSSSGSLVAGTGSRVTSTASPDFDQFAGELTHTTPLNGTSFSFGWNAPHTVGQRTLYGCINPVNFNGTEQFDGPPDCDTLTITVNSTPTANNNTFNINEDSGQTAALDLLGNDRSGAGNVNDGGDSISIDRINGLTAGTVNTANGTVTRSGNTVRYEPNDNFNGTDTFTYRIIDSLGATDTATVTINVAAVNDAPQAFGDVVGATEDTPTTFTILRNNDTDVDGDTRYIDQVTQGNRGGAIGIVAGNFSVSYSPAANFCGTETFTYRVRDRSTAGTGLISGPATVTVVVQCTADAPIANNDAPSVPRGSSNQTLTVLANDTDPDNLAAPFNAGLTISAASITSPAAAGELLSIGAGQTTLIYTPPSNFSGSRTLSYTITDGGLSDTATFTVNVQNGTAPVANGDGPFTVLEDSLASAPANTFNVLGNDTDVDGDTLTISITGQPANGTLTGDGGTVLTYEPTPDFFGTDSFRYQARDSAGGLSNEIIVSINVTNVADAPVANNDATSVARGSSDNLLDVLANDTDPDNRTVAANTGLTVSAVTIRAGQTAVTGETVLPASAGAGVRYTPPANFSGTRILDYTVSDGTSTDTAQITVTVQNGTAPVANADGPFTVQEDSILTDGPNQFAVLANDTDPDGDALTIEIAAVPLHGQLTGEGGTVLSYQPTPNYAGADSFRYRARDSAGFVSADVTVSITVANTPDAPVAVDDALSVARGSSANTLDVLLNDTDVDNQAPPLNAGLTVTAVTIVSASAAGESAAPAAGGAGILYTPPSNFSGDRVLTYTVSDGVATDTATVTINVQTGTAPQANADGPFTVAEDSLATDAANTFDVLANDTDPEGDTLSVTVTQPPLHGTLVGSGGTSLTYRPTPDYAGPDSFRYRARDSSGLTSNEIIVSITVTNVADAPIAVDDVRSVPRGSNGNVLDVLTNDTDADNQAPPLNAGLTVTAATIRAGQTVVTGESAVIASGATGVRYTPPSNFSGTRIVDYTISDGSATATAQVTITVLDGTAPIAVADGPFTVVEDSLDSAPANRFDVLANDTDPDGDALTVIVTAAPASGTLNGSGTTALTYRPNANFAGSDSFRYRARDSAGLQSPEITVSITVTPVPDAPTAVNDTVSVPRGSSANVLDVLLNDRDVDNQTGPANAGLVVTAVSIVSPATAGEAAAPSAGGAGVTYTPPPNFSGQRVLNYTVSDGGLTASGTITVGVQDSRAPRAVADGPFVVLEDSLASDLPNGFNVLANDSDADNDTLTITVTVAPTNGTLTGSGTALVTYAPNANYNGPDSFRYRARDSAGLESAEVEATITVTAQNDAPVAVVDAFPEPPAFFREDQGPFDLDVLANDTDVDTGDTREVAVLGTPSRGGTVVLLATGPNNRVRYTPALNFTGTESFTYTVRDSAGATSSTTVTVEISPVNDAPVITSTAITTTPDALPYRYQVTQTDVDDSAFTYVLTGAPTTGVPMTISPTGLVTWTPPISASLAPYTVGPITVTVTDSGGSEGPELSATQTFTITVTAPDGDGDGMPNSYENANGFDPANPADGAQDRDGDGRSNADEYLNGGNPDADDVPPVLTPPANLQVPSTGFLTAVDLGTASARDVRDGVVVVQGPAPAGPFRPGRYTITYTARDRSNNIITATQQLDVLPRVELGPDQVTGEGRAVGVLVSLNGTAPSYPVSVDYTVGGTAGGSDHDATSGRVVLASGTEALIPINIAADGAGEADETIVVTLTATGGGVLGTRRVQTTTIVERNVAPAVTLAATQMGEPRSQIFANQGAVTITATAVDVNAGDTVALDFTGTDAALGAPVGNVASFGFDPAALAPGSYRVRVTARDSAGASTTVETLLVLRASAPALTAVDTDGDGIADNAEGFTDADGDGAPDYLDRYSEPFVVADQNGQPATRRLLEAEPGVGIRVGGTALAAGRSGALISLADIAAFGGTGGGPVGNATDTLENVGGLFDFELIGVIPGSSTSVVVPLTAGLRPDSVWRKYEPTSGWRDFVVDASNRVASAAAVGGQCPAPSSTAYVNGLTALHTCVRLTLQDGGPNDADGEANGRIRDPSGAAVAAASEPEPPPSGKGGGGGGSLDLSLLVGLWTLALASLLYRNRRRGA